MAYPTPGVYNVTLTAGNGLNTVSSTQPGYILVLPATGAAMPYSQDFEAVSTLNTSEWLVWNPDAADRFYGMLRARLDDLRDEELRRGYLDQPDARRILVDGSAGEAEPTPPEEPGVPS